MRKVRMEKKVEVVTKQLCISARITVTITTLMAIRKRLSLRPPIYTDRVCSLAMLPVTAFMSVFAVTKTIRAYVIPPTKTSRGRATRELSRVGFRDRQLIMLSRRNVQERGICAYKIFGGLKIVNGNYCRPTELLPQLPTSCINLQFKLRKEIHPEAREPTASSESARIKM